MIRSLVRPPLLVTTGMLVLGAFAALGITALAGTKTGVALALAAVLGPLAVYGAICEPLVFPFTFYVMLAPFDNLMGAPAFGTLARLLAIVCGASIVLWLIRTRRAVAPDRAILLWGLLWVWSAASLTWAADPVVGYSQLFTLGQLLALYVVVSLVPLDKRTLHIVLASVVLSGTVAAGYGAYLFSRGMDLRGGRLFLSIDNNPMDPNQFAAALLLPIALALIGLLQARSLALRAAYTGALLVMWTGIAVSGSRGAVVAAAVVLIYIMLRARTSLLASGVALAVISSALALNGNIASRFSIAASTGGAGRLDIWRVGLIAFRNHFWFGAGYANFPIAFDQAFLEISEHQYTFWHRAPHNILLSAGVELGVVGLVILVAAWIVQFRALRAISRHDALYGVRIAAEAAVIGLFMAGMFLDILTFKYLWLAFMVVMLIRNAALAPKRTPLWPINSYPTTVPHSPMTS
ncbi:MAG: O-antigen ligase family protein [Candidatus Aquilonibacter sp.]